MKVDGKLMAKARCKDTDLDKASTGFDICINISSIFFLQTSFFLSCCVCVCDLKYDVCYEYAFIYIFYYLKKTPVPAQYINVWWFRATWAALCFTIGATRKGALIDV